MKKSLKNLLIYGGVSLALIILSGKISYHCGKDQRQKEILNEISKERTIIGNKAIRENMTPEKELSLQYFGHTTYMIEDLIGGDIGACDIYGELMQRARNQPDTIY